MAKPEQTPITRSNGGNDAKLTRLGRRFEMDGARLDIADARIAMQIRKDEIASGRRAQRQVNAARLRAIADQQIAANYAAELRQSERDIEAMWRRFRCRVKLAPNAKSGTEQRPKIVPQGLAQLPSYRSPIIDRQGRRGVFMNVRYHSASTTSIGVASRCVAYICRPGAVEQIDGVDAVISNVGPSVEEISAGFALIETLNRAARKNGKVAHTMVLTLPHDVPPQVRKSIIRDFCHETFGVHDLPFVAALHTPSTEGDQRNFHAHVIFSMRPCVRIDEGHWDISSELRSEFDNEDAFFHMRQVFAQTMTRNVRAVGIRRTYTHLSNVGRGLKAKPLAKLGQSKTAAARRYEYVPEVERIRRQITVNDALMAEDRSAHRKARAEHERGELEGLQVRKTDAMPLIETTPNLRTPSIPSPISGDRVARTLSLVPETSSDSKLVRPAQIAIIGFDKMLDASAQMSPLPPAAPIKHIDPLKGLVSENLVNAPLPLPRLVANQPAGTVAPLRVLEAIAPLNEVTLPRIQENDLGIQGAVPLRKLKAQATLPPARPLPLLRLETAASAMTSGRLPRVDEGELAACRPIGAIKVDRLVRLTDEEILAPYRPQRSTDVPQPAPQSFTPSRGRRRASDEETEADIALVCAIIQQAPGQLYRPYRGYMLPDWTVLPPEKRAVIEQADLKHPAIRATIQARAQRDETAFASGCEAAVSPPPIVPPPGRIRHEDPVKSQGQNEPDSAEQALEAWRRARKDGTDEIERQRLAMLAMSALGPDRLAATNDGERARLWNDADRHRQRLAMARAMLRGPERS